MRAKIFIEGGGRGKDSSQQQIDCRKGFSDLFKKCGFPNQPALTACGSRNSTFKRFKSAHAKAAPGDYIAMLVDSEDPVADPENPWQHLEKCDGWQQPSGVTDEQALLMTTSMETWVAADRKTLREHYGPKLQENSLPSPQGLESRTPQDVLKSLAGATRKCNVPYRKGKQSFEILAKLDPQELEKHLPSFARCRRILKEQLT